MPWDPSHPAFFPALACGGLVLLLAIVYYVKVGRRRPSLDRDWSPDCALIPTVTFQGRRLTIHNVRHFVWRSGRDYDAIYADEIYDLDEFVGVWYAVDHFHAIKGLAHVMLSFEFKGDRFVTCSFETRRIKGQRYHPWAGLWRGFELLLLWGGEEDILRQRTNGRKNPVYLFPCEVPEGKGETLFVLLCDRANELAKTPAWYHTLHTTCTTSLVQVINRVTPGRVPFMWRLLLPGHSPRAAYRLGLIKDPEKRGYEATLQACAITARAQAHGDAAGYSLAIRGRLGTKAE